MSIAARLRQEWLSNIPADILSGTLVALALIPEAIGFSIVAVLVFMIISMLIGAHRTVLVRPFLCAHQSRGQPGHRKHG